MPGSYSAKRIFSAALPPVLVAAGIGADVLFGRYERKIERTTPIIVTGERVLQVEYAHGRDTAYLIKRDDTYIRTSMEEILAGELQESPLEAMARALSGQ